MTEEFNFHEEIKNNPKIVNENDIQKMETIELSYDGNLIPVEEVEYQFDEFIKRLKELISSKDPKILCGVIHKNSCGEPIYDNEGRLAICCGDDLGGDNNEFAQCPDCRVKDYIDKLTGIKK